MYVALLGRQPKLSLAELIGLYPDARMQGTETACFSGQLSIHLGGSSKIGEVITRLPKTVPAKLPAFLATQLLEIIPPCTSKYNLGLSLYGPRLPGYRQLCFELKKALRRRGDKPRLIMPKEQTLPAGRQALSSAQSLHYIDLSDSDLELLISVTDNEISIARMVWRQDIEAYTHRDIGRPCRDMQVGMLPPKLAQIMLNLAPGGSIFDPFCGSGVVLQEALLMGKTASGSDLNPRMVACAQANLEWLAAKFGAPPAAVELADARDLNLPGGVQAIISETYLGPIITRAPTVERASKLAAESDELIRASLKNLEPQLPKEARLCLALPAWRTASDSIVTPALVDTPPPTGYNRISLPGIKSADLLWLRPNQYVGRQLIILEKI